MFATDVQYKTRARGKWDWRQFDTVRMEISVGQPYHEGSKLLAAMDWAFGNFKRVVLIVGDLPQRYNLMYRTGYNEESAAQIARGAGDSWLARNADAIKGAEITRWDEWRAKPEFLMNRAAISRLYAEDQEFRASIGNAMNEFIERNAIVGRDRERYLTISEQYLLEETTVFATAYNELGGISAYPGTFLETWERFINSDDPRVPEGLKKSFWARLSFDKIKGTDTSSADFTRRSA